MAPDVRRFPVRDLPVEIQANPSGRKRKMPSGSDVGLETCKLFTVSQYACEVHDEKESGGDGRVHCHEVVRYFRKYVFFFTSPSLKSFACTGSTEPVRRNLDGIKCSTGSTNDQVLKRLVFLL